MHDLIQQLSSAETWSGTQACGAGLLQKTCAPQAPPLELIGREKALLHEAESAEVAAARDAFAALRCQLVSLRAEARQPSCSVGASRFVKAARRAAVHCALR